MRLYDELENLIARLEAAGTPYALCGGLALAVHGFARATMDIDLLVPAVALDGLRAIARQLGYDETPQPLPLAGGRIVLHRFVKVADREALPLDAILVSEVLAEIWPDRQRVASGFGDIWVLSARALARMKALRNNAQDRVDIRLLAGKDQAYGR